MAILWLVLAFLTGLTTGLFFKVLIEAVNMTFVKIIRPLVVVAVALLAAWGAIDILSRLF